MRYAIGRDVSLSQRDNIEQAQPTGNEPIAHIINNGIILPFQRKQKETSEGGIIRIIHGGVYRSDESFVEQSGLSRFITPRKSMNMIEPYPIFPKAALEDITEGVYGGVILPHFGHFIIEGLSRLWWSIENNSKSPIFFYLLGAQEPARYVKKIFEILEIDARFIKPKSIGMRVKELVIPETSVVLNHTVHKKFLTPFQKIVQKTTTSSFYKNINSEGEKLFVSRGKNLASKVFGEDIVQLALQKKGYVVLDPTTEPLEKQIAAFQKAKKIVGVIGSAMHSLVYAHNAKKVAIIARTERVPSAYPAIDNAIGSYESFYIFAAKTVLPTHGALTGPYLIDAEACLQHLHECGFIDETPEIDMRDLTRSRDDYMNEWSRLNKIKKKTTLTTKQALAA